MASPLDPSASLRRGARLVALAVLAANILRSFLAVHTELIQGSEIVSACVARSYDLYGMDLFSPKVDCYTDRIRTYLGEVQLYDFAVALLYQVFGVHEVVGVLFNGLLVAVQAAVVYRLLRSKLDELEATIGTAIFAGLPVTVLPQITFNRYALSYLSAYGSLVLLDVARRRVGARRVVAMLASFVLITLSTVGYVRQIPMIGIWTVFAVVISRGPLRVVPPLLGLAALGLAGGYMWTQRITGWNPALVHGWEDAGRDYTSLANYLLWLDPDYLRGAGRTSYRLFGGVVGLGLTVLGARWATRDVRRAAGVWAAAYFGFYAVVDPKTMLLHAEDHPQGYIGFGPVFAGLVAIALGRWLRADDLPRSRPAERRPFVRGIVAVSVVVALFVSLEVLSRKYHGMKDLYRRGPTQPLAAIGRAIAAESRRSAAVLETNTVKYPFVAYYSGRLLAGTIPTDELLEALEAGDTSKLVGDVLAFAPLLAFELHPRALAALTRDYDFVRELGSTGIFVRHGAGNSPGEPATEVHLGRGVVWDGVTLPRTVKAGAEVPIDGLFHTETASAGATRAALLLRSNAADGILVADWQPEIADLLAPAEWPSGVPCRSRTTLVIPAGTPPGDYRVEAVLMTTSVGAQSASLPHVLRVEGPAAREGFERRLTWLGPATSEASADLLPGLHGRYTLAATSSLHDPPPPEGPFDLGRGPLFSGKKRVDRSVGWDPGYFAVRLELDAPIVLDGVDVEITARYPDQAVSAVEVYARSPARSLLRVGRSEVARTLGVQTVRVRTAAAETSALEIRLRKPAGAAAVSVRLTAVLGREVTPRSK